MADPTVLVVVLVREVLDGNLPEVDPAAPAAILVVDLVKEVLVKEAQEDSHREVDLAVLVVVLEEVSQVVPIDLAKELLEGNPHEADPAVPVVNQAADLVKVAREDSHHGADPVAL